MKSSFKEILLAGIVLGVIVFVLNVASCASNQNVNEPPKTETVVKNVEVQKKPKVEYTKNGFMELLHETLDSKGAEAALSLYDTELPAHYSKFKDDFDLLFLKAAICVSANKLDEAQRICDDLSKKDPKNQDVIGLSATIAKMRGDKAGRDRQVKALLAADPYNAMANIEVAEDQFSRKNYKQARLSYKKALSREPKNEDALRGLGQTEYYLEDDENAKATFNKLLEVNPNSVQAYLYLGKLAFANNEYKIASDNAKKAVELDPQNYECHMDYGLYERNLGHFDVALDEWTKAIEIQPDYFLGYAYRAGLYDEQDKAKEAIADYKKVIQLNPKYYYAYESIGVLALHEEQWTTAREAFMKCREFNASNISYPLMVTYCYYKEGKGPEAKKYSDQILRKMDRNSIEYTMLRLFHDRAGERPVPQKIAALSNRNTQGKMYYYLALFYDMFGGGDFANQYYMKVVDMKSPMFFEYRLAEWRMKGVVPLK